MREDSKGRRSARGARVITEVSSCWTPHPPSSACWLPPGTTSNGGVRRIAASSSISAAADLWVRSETELGNRRSCSASLELSGLCGSNINVSHISLSPPQLRRAPYAQVNFMKYCVLTHTPRIAVYLFIERYQPNPSCLRWPVAAGSTSDNSSMCAQNRG